MGYLFIETSAPVPRAYEISIPLASLAFFLFFVSRSVDSFIGSLILSLELIS